MQLTMQAILANVFAATMTAAVIAFPSPQAAVEAVRAAFGPDQGTEVDPTPSAADIRIAAPHTAGLRELDPDHLIEQLGDCLGMLDTATPREAEVCASVVRLVGTEHRSVALTEDRIDPINEAVILASAQLCRRSWAAGSAPLLGTVNPEICLTEALGVVEL